MKILKTFILLIIIPLLSGCNTNYQSLNNYAIVSSLLIDKIDNSYITHIELYNQYREENKSSYFITGLGNNITDSINNASKNISQDLYFIHLNTVIISYNIANNEKEIENIFNYLENNLNTNLNYYLLISNDINKLINNKDIILGENISNSIKYGTNNGNYNNYTFIDILKNYLNKNKDIYLNNVNINNDNNIKLDNGYFFNNNKLVDTLNNNEIEIINLFINNTENLYFNFNINNDYYILKINNSNIKYDFNKSNINLFINANIYETNIKNININKIKNNLKKELTIETNTLLKKLKNNKSDILGINDYIYKIYGYQKYDFFKDDFKINISLKLNNSGLINTGDFNE